MKFLLRLLALLILATYIFSHYGSFLRKTRWLMSSGSRGGLLNHLPQQTRSLPRSESPEGDLPPGVLPHHDLTPGAIDPCVAQRNMKIPSAAEGTRQPSDRPSTTPMR